MLASSYPGSAGSILRSAIGSIDSIVRCLEFAGRVDGDHWPLAGRLHGLDCLRLDLKAAAAGDGITGADVYQLVAQAHDQLLPIVEAHDQGDLAPWRSGREAVEETLRALRQLFGPELDGELVVRSAAVAVAPTPTPAATIDEPGRKGEKADKGPSCPRGRPPKATGASRKAEAAWWRDRAHLEPAIADQSEDVTLDQLFKRMMEREFEIQLHHLGAEDLPAWWPDGSDGRPVRVVRFRERWKTTSSMTWGKYVQRSDNDASRTRMVAPRHNQGNVEPQATKETKKPARITTAEAAIRAFEDAAEIASGLVLSAGEERDKLRDDIRRTLARTGIVGDDADEILDQEPVDMVAELNRRRQAVERSQAGTKTRR